jgi:hypothetical protein
VWLLCMGCACHARHWPHHGSSQHKPITHSRDTPAAPPASRQAPDSCTQAPNCVLWETSCAGLGCGAAPAAGSAGCRRISRAPTTTTRVQLQAVMLRGQPSPDMGRGLFGYVPWPAPGLPGLLPTAHRRTSSQGTRLPAACLLRQAGPQYGGSLFFLGGGGGAGAGAHPGC